MPLVTTSTTIARMFRGVTEHFAGSSKPAFQRKVDGAYVDTTYSDLYGQVEGMALGLRSLGLSRGDTVGIMSENRLEWVVADFACACSGIVDVPIFPILTARQVEYIFNDAGVKAVFCSNSFQVNKLLKVVAEIPSLTHIVVMQEEILGKGLETHGRTMISFADLLAEGRKLAATVPGQLTKLIDQVQPNDLCTLIYTSGTTGHPKGVMLSHANFVHNIEGASRRLEITQNDIVLSYLPLCHSFERTGGYYTCFACGATIAFATSIETVAENLLEVRPTLMTSVPVLFDRIKGRVEKSVQAGPEKKRKLFEWAMRTGVEYYRAEMNGGAGIMLKARRAVADKLVFTKVRARTGGRLKFFVSGGAALPTDVGEFFFAVGLTVIEGYGMTESSPVISANPYERPKLGTVGPPLDNIEVKIAEDGEILTRGGHVMLGYYKNPAATAEAINPEGWLHTGDVGRFDKEGYLIITDRKKHLFVSSGGKNIAPAPIEALLQHSPLVSQIVLIGNDRPFITALIVPDFDALKELAGSHGIDVGKLDDLSSREAMLDHDAVVVAYEGEIRRLQRDLAAYEKVRRFDLLAEPFTVENGMLTPTLKVKWKVVEERYRERIDRMYEGADPD